MGIVCDVIYYTYIETGEITTLSPLRERLKIFFTLHLK